LCTAIVWHDKCDALLLSTNFDPRSDKMVEKKVGRSKEKIKIPCPRAVANYTHYMGGGGCISMTNCVNIMV
jgi:hypothetical protein